ncbi:39S ribosomal protein L35, mitochondrial [Harpegnathos saltator]|uniref:Large ribosomal subunit protein bL35m n=1 Tax=Harpegnathos saltator TaxID=610380 RepID=E2BP42_HARSA|nr:39S ribosomal protein L35, mitochondrial [Harpegnathos saltator]EFN82539.1 39S ribosomal protein L35, mitochondrial [Harpegnathos saltator]
MLRVVSAALRGAARAANTNMTNSIANFTYNSITNYTQYRGFGALSTIIQKWATVGPVQHKTLLNHVTKNCPPMPVQPVNIPVRTVIKFSLTKGKRKTVKAVIKRFYRLNWGIWIRTKSGRHKHLWRKSAARKKRLREHVFVNATQSSLLDKMVTKYWRRPRFYVDDPYNPYHNREEFFITRKKPLP